MQQRKQRNTSTYVRLLKTGGKQYMYSPQHAYIESVPGGEGDIGTPNIEV